MDFSNLSDPKITTLLNKGKIGVLPTDTIYGVHASINHPKSIERIYQIEKRDSNKPFIILLSSPLDLEIFNIQLSPKIQSFTNKYWPGKISIILPCPNNKFNFLHRGQNSLAFRVPNFPKLQALLKKTGPLVSTSVNPQGMPPAQDISEAKKYFNNKINFYVNIGKLNNSSSTLVEIVNNQPQIIRQGPVKIN